MGIVTRWRARWEESKDQYNNIMKDRRNYTYTEDSEEYRLWQQEVQLAKTQEAADRRRYEYLLSQSGWGTRYFKDPIAGVFIDIANPTDFGDILSLGRLGILAADIATGPGKTFAAHALIESGFGAADTVVDTGRRIQRGEDVSAKTITTDFALNMALPTLIMGATYGIKKLIARELKKTSPVGNYDQQLDNIIAKNIDEANGEGTSVKIQESMTGSTVKVAEVTPGASADATPKVQPQADFSEADIIQEYYNIKGIDVNELQDSGVLKGSKRRWLEKHGVVVDKVEGTGKKAKTYFHLKSIDEILEELPKAKAPVNGVPDSVVLYYARRGVDLSEPGSILPGQVWELDGDVTKTYNKLGYKTQFKRVNGKRTTTIRLKTATEIHAEFPGYRIGSKNLTDGEVAENLNRVVKAFFNTNSDNDPVFVKAVKDAQKTANQTGEPQKVYTKSHVPETSPLGKLFKYTVFKAKHGLAESSKKVTMQQILYAYAQLYPDSRLPSDQQILEMIKKYSKSEIIRKLAFTTRTIIDQFNKMGRSVDNFGSDNKTVMEHILPIMRSVNDSLKEAIDEINNGIIAISKGSDAKIMNVRDFLNHVKEQNIDIARAMMYPEIVEAGTWERKVFEGLHQRLNTYFTLQDFMKLDNESDIIIMAKEYGVFEDLFEQLEELADISEKPAGALFKAKVIPDLLRRQNYQSMMNKIGDKYGSDFIKAVMDVTGLQATEAYKVFKDIFKDIDTMSQKAFRAELEKASPSLNLGQGQLKRVMEVFKEMKKKKVKVSRFIREVNTIHAIDNKMRVRRVEMMKLYVNLQSVLHDRGIIGFHDKTVGTLATKYYKTLEDMPSDVRKQFEETIAPYIKKYFKYWNQDTYKLGTDMTLNLSKWGRDTSVKIDFSKTTVGEYLKMLEEYGIDKADSLSKMNTAIDPVFREYQTAIGRAIKLRYPQITSPVELVELYIQKYNLDPNIVVQQVQYNGKYGWNGAVGPGKNGSLQVLFNFAPDVPLEHQLGVARHEIEHLLDIDLRGVGGINVPARGNPQGLDVPGLSHSYRYSSFKIDQAKFLQGLDDDTPLREAIGHYVNDHFYNFATDTFEASYADFIEQGSKPFTNLDIYKRFMDDLMNATIARGKTVSMNEILTKYFQDIEGMENFMFDKGFDPKKPAELIMRHARDEAWFNATGMRKGAFIHAYTVQAFDQYKGMLGDKYKNEGWDDLNSYQQSQILGAFRSRVNQQIGKFDAPSYVPDNEKFTMLDWMKDFLTYSIIGFRGAKEVFTVSYNVIERSMAAGQSFSDGLKDMVKIFPHTLKLYLKANVYAVETLSELLMVDVLGKDMDSIWMSGVFKKMKKFGQLTEGTATQFDETQLMNYRVLLQDMYSWGEPATLATRRRRALARALSTLEQGDMLGEHLGRMKSTEHMNHLAATEVWADLPEIERRMVWNAGYNEASYAEFHKQLADLHKAAPSIDYSELDFRYKSIKDAFHTGEGYYNRVGKSRMTWTQDPMSKHISYLMHTVHGIAADTADEVFGFFDKGVYRKYYPGDSKENLIEAAKKVGFVALTALGPVTGIYVIDTIHNSIGARKLILPIIDKDIEEFKKNPKKGALKMVTSMIGNSAVGATFSQFGGTAVGAGYNFARKELQYGGILKLTTDMIFTATAMNKFRMLRGDEKLFKKYLNSEEFKKDVQTNIEKYGESTMLNYRDRYEANTQKLIDVWSE